MLLLRALCFFVCLGVETMLYSAVNSDRVVRWVPLQIPVYLTVLIMAAFDTMT